MPTKIEGQSSHQDLIDDIVETPSSLQYMMDASKSLPNMSYSRYSSIPSLFNSKSKLEQNPTTSTSTLASELRDRLHLTLPRSSSSSTMLSNDERRKELDLVLKHLYDGKLLTSMHDDRASSEISEPSIPLLSKAPITTTTTTNTMKNEDDSKTHAPGIDLLVFDDDGTSLQRELQEKELDIIHLHKEIQELQLENKLLRAKVPTGYQNGHSSSHGEVEALRREKDVLENELRIQQELVAKSQLQQHQNVAVARSNRIDEVTQHQKEVLEKKLKACEKQMCALTSDNDKLKQYYHESERTMAQLKRDNEELQQKVNEAKKRNDELFYQELSSLRNDLKILKQRNDELFEDNHRLQQDYQRQQKNLAWRSPLQPAYVNNEQAPPHLLPMENLPPPSPTKALNSDARRERPRINRSESPNLSEASDSTNYLTTVSAERYHTRPPTSMHRSATIDGNNHHRTTRYNATIEQESNHRTAYSSPLSKSIDPLNYRPSKSKRSVEWDEQNIQQNEGSQHHRELSNNYESPYRSHRQHSANDTNEYLPPSHLSSQSYQQNYGLSRSVTLPESQHNSRRSNTYSIPSMRQMNGDEEVPQEERHYPRQRRPSIEAASPRRPYAPSAIAEIRMNDVVKFSRPGGKISKGIVKYVGSLPGKGDQYLGLELEDEESKHDGVYQGQRLFQCKPNKGVFVGFSKVIMAWSGK